MSPIPKFTNRGLLPGGFHHATLQEFHDRFVAAFPHSSTRASIYEGFCRLLDDLAEFGVLVMLWADGSYITRKANPRDLDLVLGLDAGALNDLPTIRQRQLEGILARCKEEYLCHVMIVVIYPERHPKRKATNMNLTKWRKWFGHTRQGETKGIIVLPIDEQVTEEVAST